MAFGPVTISTDIYTLPPATRTDLGGVVVGDNLFVDSNGRMSVNVDKTLTVDGAPANAKTVKDELNKRYTKKESDLKYGPPYTLPVATENVLGGVKQGSSIEISPDGVINVRNVNGFTFAAQTSDPGENSPLETGKILFIYE